MSVEEFEKGFVGKSNLSYFVLKAILQPILWLLYRPVFHHAERIPDNGATLLCGNHRCFLDPLFVCVATKRPVHYLATESIYKNGLGFFLKLARAIPVLKSDSSHRTLIAAERELLRGWVIGLFPEGTRNYTDEILLPFRYGAVRLSKATAATIVPLAITGRFIPFVSRIHVYFGEPYALDENADIEEENEKLRKAVYDLYTEHARVQDDARLRNIRY